MFRTGQLSLVACLSVLVGGSFAGCAASSIDDLSDDALANEDPPSEDAGDAPADDDEPVVPTRDASTPKDAAAKDASAAKDAGTSQDAAATKDASADAATKDASTPKDAAVADACAPKDASTPTKDAATADPGQCTVDSQCTQTCLITGIFPCCKADHSCGCTYVPGTLCL